VIKLLVVNGCSYTQSYSDGNGHIDLARRLGIVGHHNIPLAVSLAIGGSANSRILRTALKHSYITQVPTLYVLGMTFVSRLELPICNPDDEFEGTWCNPQNQEFESRWQHQWTVKDSEQFVKIKLKSEVYSILDRTEDLMYRMISAIADIRSRGHRVLMFQQADSLYQEHLSDPRLKLFQRPEIIEGFAWRSVAWQHAQGVEPTIYAAGSPYVPPDITHPKPGQHQLVNEYLTNYIQEHKILA
jgi:hypothetical protein